MLPVVERDGKSTARAILAYAILFFPVTLMPTFLHFAGKIYFVAAIAAGRVHVLGESAHGDDETARRVPRILKKYARQLLLASVTYLAAALHRDDAQPNHLTANHFLPLEAGLVALLLALLCRTIES